MTSLKAPPGGGKDFVRALERGLTVLHAFNGTPAEMTLSEVATRSNLDRQATWRILMTLQELGYVRRKGRQFRVTPRVFDLGYAYLSSMSVVELATPHLRLLVRELDESASLAVLDQPDIRLLAHLPVDRLLNAALFVGTKLPALSTALGQVLLAAFTDEQLADYLARDQEERPAAYETRNISEAFDILSSVRTRGWAFVADEPEFGIRSIAVPVQVRTGLPVAALGLFIHASRWDIQEIECRYLSSLRNTAALIESDLQLVERLRLSQ